MSLDRELAALDAFTGQVEAEFSSKSVTDNGTLILKGLAIGWGADRENEEFDEATTRSAFLAYLKSNPVLCVQHNMRQAIGKVTGGQFTSKGVEVEAEIPQPAPTSDLWNFYNLVKTGAIKSFSIGGKWKRLPRFGAPTKLVPVEFVETSIAPVGVHRSTTFSVVGSKMLRGSDLDNALGALAKNFTPPGQTARDG